MTETSVLVPAQLRKHIVRNLDPTTQGERELKASCVRTANEMSQAGTNALNSCDIELTNAAIGAGLVIARAWIGDKNGNNSMAGKSFCKRAELLYVPDDPSDTRYAIKMPKSLSEHFIVAYQSGSNFGDRPWVVEDFKRVSWVSSGMTGRVQHGTLGYLLKEVEKLMLAGKGAAPRAADNFLRAYSPAYKETVKLIAEHLGSIPVPVEEPAAVEEVQEDQVPEKVGPGGAWYKGALRNVPNLPSRGRSNKMRIWFGGRAGKRNPVPAQWRKVGISYTGDGQYELYDVETDEALMMCTLANQIHWAPIDSAGVEDDHQEQDKPQGREVPENIRYMAEEADTESARAYWTRLVERYQLGEV